MRASRVPLNAGACVPEPSAPKAPLTAAGIPAERRVRCMDVAASTWALAAASCWAGVLTGTLLEPPHAASATTISRARAIPRLRMVRTLPGAGVRLSAQDQGVQV